MSSVWALQDANTLFVSAISVEEIKNDICAVGPRNVDDMKYTGVKIFSPFED